MTYVVSLQNLYPPARYDGVPWLRALIEEAAAADGPYTVIDTLPLSPADPDPSVPLARSFTTENAALAGGWYRVTFEDAAGLREPAAAIFRGDPRTSYTPTVADVAALVKTRTVDRYGNRIGTFTADTRPTDDEVEALIAIAASVGVGVSIGYAVPQELWDAVKSVIALRTALLLEISYFNDPERGTSGASAQLKALYNEAIEALKEAKLNLGGILAYEPADRIPLIY